LGERDAADLLFAVVVLVVILSELTGPFFTRNILVRAGEISPRMEDALAGGGPLPTRPDAPTPDRESS